jgi:chemotaxis family two-component system response regulator Rcp1
MLNLACEILLAEDNTGDVFLVREALLTHNLLVNLHVVRDGEAAITFIEAAEQGDDSPCPQLAVLDLNLPRKTGLEVLERLRRSTKLGSIPVALISSSRSPNDVSITHLKADYFFTKPSDYEKFMALGGIIKSLLQRSAVAQ